MAASTSPRVVSEWVNIRFEFLNHTYCGPKENATGFIKGLTITQDKASLIYKQVVIARSIVSLTSNNNFSHQQYMWHDKGPFSSEQLLQMMQYDSSISIASWYEYMRTFNPNTHESFD